MIMLLIIAGLFIVLLFGQGDALHLVTLLALIFLLYRHWQPY